MSTKFPPGTRVYDRFRHMTSEVVSQIPHGYMLRRVGSPPQGMWTPIAMGEEYACDAKQVQPLPAKAAKRRNSAASRRRNGELVDLASRRKPAPAAAAPAPMSHEARMKMLAKYLAAHADAGITAMQMAHDLALTEDGAERLLEGVAERGLLVRRTTSGQTVYRKVEAFQAPTVPAPGFIRLAAYIVPDDVIPVTAKYGDRIASVERAGDRFRVVFGTADRDGNGRFEFRVARQQPSDLLTQGGAEKAVARWTGVAQLPGVPRKAPGPFVQHRSDATIAAHQARAARLGEEARARTADARYPIGTVVTLKGGRRRYVVAKLEPRYGDVQTYLLVALSGGEAGSVPSGVREDEIRRHADQAHRWEGVHAHKLQRNFVTYAAIGETGNDARSASARAREMVQASPEIHIDPGVGLLQQLHKAFRHTSSPLAGRMFKHGPKVALAPGGRKNGVAYVTVSGWTKDSELRDKLHDAVNRLVQVGLGEHINSIEAYLGRIIVTAAPAPARNAERVWAELARVAENAEVRGNPKKRKNVR